MLRQSLPHGIRVDLPLDELLPQHALGYDPEPLFAHELGRAQRPGVQIGQDHFGYGQEAFGGQRGYKVPLQHRLQKVVDVPVLKVAHAPQQILDKLGLFDGRPPVKVVQADLLLLVELVREHLVEAVVHELGVFVLDLHLAVSVASRRNQRSIVAIGICV